jgi:signal transduction histidine kinase
MKQEDYLEIKVSDTGVGIPPEIIDSIFEPYSTTEGVGEGTGMGSRLEKRPHAPI